MSEQTTAAAYIDALRWLAHQAYTKNAEIPAKNRFLFRRTLTNRFFITLDKNHNWFLGVPEKIRTLQWFPHLPWIRSTLIIEHRIITLVASPFVFPKIPNVSIKNRESNSPLFIDMMIHPLICRELKHGNKINIGVYSQNQDNPLVSCKTLDLAVQ